MSAAVDFYCKASQSINTQRAYESDLRMLHEWGVVVPADPPTVAEYLADQASWLSPYTLVRRLSALRHAHRKVGLDDPTDSPVVKEVMKGIWRVHGRRQKQSRALSLDEIRLMLPVMVGRKGYRDRAMTLLAFRAALRRSEVVGINVEDVAFSDGGLLVHIRKSKTDQQAIGRIVSIPRASRDVCAVGAVLDWLQESRIEAGPVFRSIHRGGEVGECLSAQSVGGIICAYAREVGVESCGLSAHSLRIGFITGSIKHGASVASVQRQSGHRRIETLFRYVRTGNPFAGNANQAIDRGDG